MSNRRISAKSVPERDVSAKRTSLLSAFRRARGGATAVEFAFVAIPFFMLLCGIMEVAMIFIASTTLENATTQAARSIRTGQLQTSGTPDEASFKKAICDQMVWMASSCSANLYIDVRTSNSFATLAPPAVITGGAINPAALTFAPGAPQQITVVRAFYRWPMIVPGLTGAMGNLGTATLLSSTAAFRTEPYATSGTLP